MPTFTEITKGLDNVRTAGQAKIAIGEASKNVGNAYSKAFNTGTTFIYGLKNDYVLVLDELRAPLEQWWGEVRGLPDDMDYTSQFRAKRNLIEKAYLYVAAIGVDIDAKQTTIFGIPKVIGETFSNAPKIFGTAVNDLATGVGNVAGNVVGGLLSGLGPVLVAVIAGVILLSLQNKVKLGSK